MLDGPTAAFCAAPAQVCTEGTDVWRSPWRAHEGTANYGRAGVWRTALPSGPSSGLWQKAAPLGSTSRLRDN